MTKIVHDHEQKYIIDFFRKICILVVKTYRLEVHIPILAVMRLPFEAVSEVLGI